jgi:hypothetical protein
MSRYQPELILGIVMFSCPFCRTHYYKKRLYEVLYPFGFLAVLAGLSRQVRTSDLKLFLPRNSRTVWSQWNLYKRYVVKYSGCSAESESFNHTQFFIKVTHCKNGSRPLDIKAESIISYRLLSGPVFCLTLKSFLRFTFRGYLCKHSKYLYFFLYQFFQRTLICAQNWFRHPRVKSQISTADDLRCYEPELLVENFACVSGS